MTVIFDMDGVIVDSEPIYMAVEQEVFRSLGLVVSPEEHERYLGVSWRDMLADINERYSRSVTMDELRALARDLFVQLTPEAGIPFVVGAVPLMREIDSHGVLIGIASSSTVAAVRETIRRGQLDGVVDAYTGGDEVTLSKPDPEIFLVTAEKLGVQPRECVVVEDSPNGVKAARSAGMRSIGFQNPSSGSPDLRAADFVCDSMKAVRDLLFTDFL